VIGKVAELGLALAKFSVQLALLDAGDAFEGVNICDDALELGVDVTNAFVDYGIELQDYLSEAVGQIGKAQANLNNDNNLGDAGTWPAAASMK
jgi:hypothetical protein